MLLFAALVIAVVLFWSTRFGVKGRSAGTSLRRGPRAHTTSTGRAKVPYATRDEALAKARSMRGRDGVGLGAYQCGTCGKWHVGHS